METSHTSNWESNQSENRRTEPMVVSEKTKVTFALPQTNFVDQNNPTNVPNRSNLNVAKQRASRPSAAQNVANFRGKVGVKDNEKKTKGNIAIDGEELKKIFQSRESEESELYANYNSSSGESNQNKVPVKPQDQLKLTDEELKAEITKIYSTKSKVDASNQVAFSLKTCSYINCQTSDTKDILIATIPTHRSEEISKNSENLINKNKKPFNQFNFCERGTQTKNEPMVDRETNIEQMKKHNHSAQINQWTIYNLYVAHHIEQKTKNAENTPQQSNVQNSISNLKPLGDNSEADKNAQNKRIERTFRVLERAVLQMRYGELNMELKFWHSATGKSKILLPLWLFAVSKNNLVTAELPPALFSWTTVQTKCCQWLNRNWPGAQPVFVAATCYSYTSASINTDSNPGSASPANSLEIAASPQKLTILSSYSIRNPRYAERTFQIEDCAVISLDCHQDPKFSGLVCATFDNATGGVFNFDLPQGCDNSSSSMILDRSGSNRGSAGSNTVVGIKWLETIQMIQETRETVPLLSFVTLQSNGRIELYRVNGNNLKISRENIFDAFYCHQTQIELDNGSEVSTNESQNNRNEEEVTDDSSITCLAIDENQNGQVSSDPLIIFGNDKGQIATKRISDSLPLESKIIAHKSLITGLRLSPFDSNILISYSECELKIWDRNSE
ncbi:MAG: cytoplasmic dynein with WD40 domain [Marteilia pararefringens]